MLVNITILLVCLQIFICFQRTRIFVCYVCQKRSSFAIVMKMLFHIYKHTNVQK